MRLGLAHLGLDDDLLLVGRVLRVEHGERLAEGACEGGREDEADLTRTEGAHAAQPVLARDLQVERGVLARLGDLDQGEGEGEGWGEGWGEGEGEGEG